MKPTYPDLEWYAGISERKNITGRCPFASVHLCPRYFESVALLSDIGITTKLPADVHDAMLNKWKNHHAWPVTDETAAAAFGGGEKPGSFTNFCPEVAFDTFRLFACKLIKFHDSLDREYAERALVAEGATNDKDWRWNWQHVDPMHYSQCPVYAKLFPEAHVTQINNFNAPVTGQVNVAGSTITSAVLQLSIQDFITRIDSLSAPPVEKEAAKSKLKEFLAHPLVAAIAEGIAGGVTSF